MGGMGRCYGGTRGSVEYCIFTFLEMCDKMKIFYVYVCERCAQICDMKKEKGMSKGWSMV